LSRAAGRRRGWQANTTRRRNVAITNDIRGDTRCDPRC
jgi:hypothetical protein